LFRLVGLPQSGRRPVEYGHFARVPAAGAQVVAQVSSGVRSQPALTHLECDRSPVDRVLEAAYLRQMELWCAECLLMADDEARGWRLLRVDVPGEDDEPILAGYCPECAEREFGPVRRIDPSQADLP
jgi:hypothetical protein